MSPVTDYQWRSNLGGTVMSDMQRASWKMPKRMYADLALDSKRGAGLAMVCRE
jgi:hypothetical protein